MALPAAPIATFFGVGHLPIAPGTWGSLAGGGVAAALVIVAGDPLAAWLLAAATVAGYPLGVWASARYAAAIGDTDPSAVVIDEVVGQWLALLPVLWDWRFYPLAFVLFRLADIVKPWPAGRAERLPGGTGIMADDVVAGAYAGIVVWLLATLLGSAPTLTNLFG